MKATIEIPDELYRRVKAKSALEGRSVREVTVDLYQRWLRGECPGPVASSKAHPSAAARMEEWFRICDELMVQAPAGSSARAIMDEDRKRLESR